MYNIFQRSKRVRKNRGKKHHTMATKISGYKFLFNFLYFVFQTDQEEFCQMLWISAHAFEYILGHIRIKIFKKDTPFRKAIPPEERLSVTLKFLATGGLSLKWYMKIAHNNLINSRVQCCHKGA